MKHKKIFESEDCESWAVKLNYDIPLKNSIKNMLDEMLDNYTVTNKKLESQNIDKNGYVSQISFLILMRHLILKLKEILGNIISLLILKYASKTHQKI